MRSSDLSQDTGLPEGKMKRILLTASALAVLSISANARDDRLPANFVGDWCFAEHTADHLAFYRRGRCANPDNIDDWLTINPDSFDIHELHCQVLVARSNKRGDYSLSTVGPPPRRPLPYPPMVPAKSARRG
jgi:hypothetical protein